MKLLFIIHNISFCGAERVLSIIVNELAKRKHKIYVLTDPRKVSYTIDPHVTILDAYQGIDIDNKKGFLGTVARYLVLMIRQFGIIRRTMRKINPDVTISFMGMCIWQLFPQRKRYRTIISDHSAMDREFSKKMNYERRRLPEYFYRQTVLTQIDKDFLGSSRTNVVVLSDPLTFPVISLKVYEELFLVRKHVFACGSIERYQIKGIDNLIKAFSIAAKGHPEWILDIAGKGSDDKLKELNDLAEQFGVKSQVVFLGFRNDIDELMKTHALFVHAPRSEGFGMVLTEAMACGCPVISYNLSGPSEIIKNNEDGILIENQDIESLAKAIGELMSNSERRYQIGKKALESVQRFSVSSIVDKWELLFKGEL